MQDLGAPAAPTRNEEAPTTGSRWWQRERLTWDGDTLMFAGRPVDQLVAEHGAVMAYDLERVRSRVRALSAAFSRTGRPHQLYYAIKANRFGPVVQAIRDTGVCGIDCCSPAEVGLALEEGFDARRISFTGCSVSNADVAAIAELPIRFNVNSISSIHKVGHQAPGRAIGLRLNPGIGVGASPGLTYAGKTPTKFGIYPDRVPEALRLARSYGLRVEGVHMHVGSGWLGDGLPTFGRAVRRLAELAGELGDELRYVNVGGGIGVVHADGQVAVDLDAYATAVADAVRNAVGADVEVCCEPGEYIVNDSCITAATVTEVEEKGGVLYVGLDIGFNANPQAAHYGFTPEVLSASRGPAGPGARSYVVTGNVNEVIDVFNPAARLPDVHEGDVLALLPTGAYTSAMQSNHCLRALPRQVAL